MMNIVDKYVKKPKVKTHKSTQNQGSWIGNVMKSLGYASFDVLEELAPSTVDFAKTTMNIGQDMFTALNTAKSSDRTLKSALEKNYYYGLGKDVFKNSLEDLKSGKLYNKERQDVFDAGDDDFDFGDMGFGDDEDFDFGDDDFSDSVESSDGETTATFKRKKSGNNEITQIAVNTDLGPDSTIVQATQYQTETTVNVGKAMVDNSKAQNRAVVNLLASMNNSFGSALISMSENVTEMTSIVTENLSKHTSLSAKYYEDSISLQQQILEHLKNNLHQGPSDQINTKQFKEYNNIMDLFSSGGALDVKGYLGIVKKQFGNYVDNNMFLSQLKFMNENRETMSRMATNPLSTLVSSSIRALIPKVVENSLYNLDKQLKTTFVAGLGQISGLKNSNNPFLRAIGEIFGIRNKTTTIVDKSQYNKGAMSWTGTDHQALTNVIPTLLRKIYANISGTEEIGFDYESGTFKTVSSIEKEQRTAKKNRETSEFSDVKSKFNEYLDDSFAMSPEDKKKAMEYMDKFIIGLVKDSAGGRTWKKGGRNGKSNRDDIAELTGLSSNDTNVMLMRSFFEGLSETDKAFLSEIFGSKQEEQRARLQQELEKIQNDPTRFNTMYMDTGLEGKNATDAHLLHDDKNDKSRVTGIKSGVAAGSIDKYGKTSLYYLRNILKTLNTGIYVVPITGSDTIVGSDDKGRTGNQILDAIVGRNKGVTEEYKRDSDKISKKKKSNEVNSKYSEEKKQKDIEKGKVDPTEMDQGTLTTLARGRAKKEKTDSNVEKKSFLGKILDFVPEDSGFAKIVNNFRKKFSKGGGKVADVIDSISKGLFELVFGAEDGSKGMGLLFRRAMSLLKSNFKKFGSFLDDKILKPLNDALFGDDGLISRIKESDFGHRISDIFNNLTDKVGSFMFGNKNADGKREGGIFSETIESLKGIGTQVKEGIFGEKGPDGKPLPLEQDNSVLGGLKRIVKGTTDQIGDSLGLDKSKGSFTDKMLGAFDGMASRISQRASDWGDVIFGPKDENNSRLNDVFNSDFAKRFKDDLSGQKGYIGATTAIGVLSSLFLPGGPIGGALLGAGYGIVKKSTGLQNFLFGPEDENGDRQGGLIIKEVQDFFNKHKFGMGAGAFAGLLSSFGLLPSFFLPGGPIGGALIGTGISMVAKSDAFDELLYGPGGTKDNPTGGFREKFTKIFGKDKDTKTLALDAGIGAGVGILGSFFLPGGPILGALVGSTVSIATATNKFRDWFFGEDVDGKRSGGVLGKFKDKFSNFFLGEKGDDGKRRGGILDQFTTSIKIAQTYIGEFVETQMILPFKSALEPLTTEAKNAANRIKESITGVAKSIKKRFEDIVIKPVGNALKKHFIDPMKNFFQKLFSGFGKIVGSIISAPFKIIEGFGNAAYEKQKREGVKDYREGVNKKYSPFKKENWDVDENAGFFGKARAFLGAGVNWFKKYNDQDALYNAQFSDKGAWYDRNRTVKKPERDQQAKDEAHNKWAERRRQIRGGYDPRDDRSTSKVEKDKTSTKRTIKKDKSNNTKVNTNQLQDERRRKLKKKYKAGVEAGHTGEDLRRDTLGWWRARKSAASSGYNFATWSDKYNHLDRVKRDKDNTEPDTTRVETPNRDNDVSQIKEKTTSIFDLLGSKFDGVLERLDKLLNSNKKPETPSSKSTEPSSSTDQSTSGTSKPSSENKPKTKGSSYSIDKDVSRIADSVYGQLNGVGSNINKIYKLLLKKFGVKDDDIKGDNNKSYVGFFGRIRTALNNPIKAITNAITAPFRKIGQVLTSGINKVKNLGSNLIIGIKNIGGGLLSAVGSLAKNLLNLGVDILKLPVDLARTGLSLLRAAAPALGEGLKAAVGLIGDGLLAAGSVLVSTVKTVGNVFVESAKGFGKLLGGAMQGLGSILGTFGLIGKDVLKGLWSGAKFAAKKGIGLVGAVASSPFKAIGWAKNKITGNKDSKYKKTFRVIVDGGTLDKVGIVSKVGTIEKSRSLSGGPTSSTGINTSVPLALPSPDIVLQNGNTESGKKNSLKSIFESTKNDVKNRIDEARAKQAQRGSRESLLQRLNKGDKEKEEQSFKTNVLGFLKRSTTATEEHKSSFFKVFDIKKGLITAGLIALAPLVFKFLKKLNIGSLISGIASGIVTGVKEIGGITGLLYNGKELVTQANGVINGTNTHYKLDENGQLVYDENGKIETETTDSSRVAEALMPTRTRVDTDTGEFENKKIWTGTSDTAVTFGANRARTGVRLGKKIFNKAKDTIDTSKTAFKGIKSGAKKAFDYATSKSDKLTAAYVYADDAVKGAKTAIKNKAAASFETVKATVKTVVKDDSKGIGKAVGLMKDALSLLVDKFSNLAQKYGKKVTESSFGGILTKVKGILNAEKLAKNSSIAGKITKFLAKWTTKATAAAVTLLMSEVGFALVGAVSGACNAGALFEVDPKNVDAKMRAIAAVFKGLLSTSIGSWVDLINSLVYELLGFNFVKEIASWFYKFISSDEKSNELEDAQKQFTEDYEAQVDKEYEAYVENAEANGQEVMSKEDFISKGLATTRSEYNAETNKSLTKRAVDTVQTIGRGAKKTGKTVVKAGKSAISSVKDTGKSIINGAKGIINAAFSGDLIGFYKQSAVKDNGDTSVIGNGVLGIQRTLLSPVVLATSVFKTIKDKLSSNSDEETDSDKNAGNFLTRLYNYTDPDVKIDGWEKETLTGGKGNFVTDLISAMIKRLMWLPVNVIRTVRSAFSIFTNLFDSDDDNDTGESATKSSKTKKKKKGIFSKITDKLKGLFGGSGGDDGGHPIYGMGEDDEYYYSQNDPKYKNKKYKQTGVGTSSDDTIGESGCGPTAMAMVASKMSNKKYDPLDMARLSEAGGYSTSLGTSPEYFNAAANTLGIPSKRYKPSAENLETSLASGDSVILQGVKSSGNNSPFTSQGHYVVASGMGGDTVNISDPRGREYSGQYKLSDVLNDSTGMWSFGGKGESKNSPRGIIRRIIKGGKGGDTDKWISIIKSVKQAIAAQKPGYNQSGSVTISVGGKSLKVRTDCSGFVSACLKYFGVLDEGTNLNSRQITDKDNATMKATGFTPGSWPGWDSLQEGDILALNGHTEIFAYNDGNKHYVYNCGSNSSVNNPNATYTAHKEGYSTVWRCGPAGSLAISGTDTDVSGSSSGATTFSSLSDVFSQMGSVFSNSILNSLGVKTEDTSSSDSSDSSISAKNISLSGNNYASQIWNYLTKDEGLNPVAASGVMGCWQVESGNNPTTVEGYYLDGYPGYEKVMSSNEALDDYVKNVLFPAYDRKGKHINKPGYVASDGHYYPGIGLAQWTAGRAANLKKFADSNGKDWRTLDTQLNYFSDYPGEFNDKGIKSSMNNAKTTDEATQIFAKKYEGSSADSKRKSSAKQIYSQFGGKGGNDDGGKPIKTVSTRRTPNTNVTPYSSSMSSSSAGMDKIVQSNNSKSISSKETSQLLNMAIQYLSIIADNTEDTSNGIGELNNKDFGSTQNINNITNNNVANATDSKAKNKSTSIPADRSKYNMAKRVAAGILY